MRKFPILIPALAWLLAGCAGGPGEPGDLGLNKTTLGTVLGGVGGAVAGGALFGGRHGAIGQGGTSRMLGAVGGGLLGAMAGNSVGRSLDRVDQMQAERAAQRAAAAPIGAPIVWSNPETGSRGSVVATREGHAASGAYCREFQQTITVGGETRQGYGTACREPDGQWRLQP